MDGRGLKTDYYKSAWVKCPSCRNIAIIKIGHYIHDQNNQLCFFCNDCGTKLGSTIEEIDNLLKQVD